MVVGSVASALSGDASQYISREVVTNMISTEPHYSLGRDGKKYYVGNGAVYRIDGSQSVRIAGIEGQGGFSPDGSLALGSLMRPSRVAVDTNGVVYISEKDHGRVLKIQSDGTLVTIAGNGTISPSVQRDNYAQDASQTAFISPGSLVFGPDGLLYVEDYYNSIRRINTDGSTQVVVGNFDSEAPVYNEGGVANQQQAPINGAAMSITFDNEGQLFFTTDGFIYKVDNQGYITKFAGGSYPNPTRGPGIDYDVYKLDLSIDHPSGLAFDNDNNLYYTTLVTSPAHVVRIQSDSGNARVFLGQGTHHEPGYYGPADGLGIDRPRDIYISDNDTLTFLSRNSNGIHALKEVFLDMTPPLISPVISPSPNTNGWNNTDTTVAFNCIDDFSGVAQCVNSHPAAFTQDGVYVVNGQAADNSGNTSALDVVVKVDKTAPILTNVTINPNKIKQNQLALISANASDNLSGINFVEFYVDNDPGTGNGTRMNYNSGTASISTLLNVAKGRHSLYVRAVDLAGNAVTSPPIEFMSK